MLAAAAAVVITAFVVTIWLLTIAGHAKPGTDQANARLDAVRTGLAAGATDLTDRDATERRITGPGPVPADHPGTGMRGEPVTQRPGFPARQDVDGPPGGDIDQDRGIDMIRRP